jgi:hypothetical protein
MHTEKRPKLKTERLTKIIYLVCSEVPIPFLRNECESGYYVSVPFTATTYYVLVQPSKDEPFYAYGVTLEDTPHYVHVELSDLEQIVEILERANAYDLSKIFRQITGYIKGSEPVKVTQIKPLDKGTIGLLNTAVQLGDLSGTSQEIVMKYLDLKGKPNVTLYPTATTSEIKMVEEHLIDYPSITAKIPIAPPFDTDYYKQTAVAEIVNTENRVRLKKYLEFYIKYKVSRPVIYTPAITKA